MTYLYLNFDAEEELARPAPLRPVDRSARALAALARGAEALAPLLPTHLVPLLPSAATSAAGAAGAQRALTPGAALLWCPTAAAVAEVAALGLTPCSARALALDAGAAASGAGAGCVTDGLALPTEAALSAANDRATFAARSPLPGGVIARTFEEVERALLAGAPGARWLLRRGLSANGRGARRVWSGAALPPGDAEWLRAALRPGAVTCDPFVTITREFALHGWLDAQGEVSLGVPCLQVVDEHGGWRATRRLAGDAVRGPREHGAREHGAREHGADEHGADEHRLLDALSAAARDVAATLHQLRYHGPFGIDAYEWRDDDGALRLRAPSEVNARFSLGWWVGMLPR
ncbi:MAG: hypothetical protein R3F49_19980 [Planctomycetota bacterium]